MPGVVVIDFETRSEAELKKTGQYRYAVDPSTDILCLAWRYRGEPDVYLWHPAMPNATVRRRRMIDPATGKQFNGYPDHLVPFAEGRGLPEEGRDALEDLFVRILLDDLQVEAHNSAFERYIWRHVGERLYGFPRLNDDVWRCTAALARSFALPGKLEDAAKALGLKELKDESGSALLRRLSKKSKPTKKNPEPHWKEDVEDLLALYEYCRQDVRSEDELSCNLRPLAGAELAVWQLDQRMNERGVPIDVPLARKAVEIAEHVISEANHELAIITDGAVPTTSSVAKLVEWCHENGTPIPDLTAGTVESALSDNPPWAIDAHVYRALELRALTSKSSVKKYGAFLEGVVDGRVRDLLAYHGASTGRWAGRRVQPQNFVRGNLKELLGEMYAAAKGDTMDFICRLIHECSYAELVLIFGEKIVSLLSNALRGTICAEPGFELIAADYAAIEARVTFWLAGQEDMLEVMRKSDRKEGPDIYRVMAGDIYKRPGEQIAKDSQERQLGKAAVLGLGFQMGGPKFVSSAATYKVTITEEFANEVVKAYRERCHHVVQLWRDLEDGAIAAVLAGPGAEPIRVGRLQWAVRGRFLHLKLPSGRLLSYCDPRVAMQTTPWGEERHQLRFMGIHPKTHQWCELATYGGSLTENAVQATARDLMREAMLRLDETDTYTVILTVHDEVVSEVREGEGDLKEYEALVAQSPTWADGIPIVAEGWRARRYRK